MGFTGGTEILECFSSLACFGGSWWLGASNMDKCSSGVEPKCLFLGKCEFSLSEEEPLVLDEVLSSIRCREMAREVLS